MLIDVEAWRALTGQMGGFADLFSDALVQLRASTFVPSFVRESGRRIEVIPCVVAERSTREIVLEDNDVATFQFMGVEYKGRVKAGRYDFASLCRAVGEAMCGAVGGETKCFSVSFRSDGEGLRAVVTVDEWRRFGEVELDCNDARCVFYMLGFGSGRRKSKDGVVAANFFAPSEFMLLEQNLVGGGVWLWSDDVRTRASSSTITMGVWG